MHGTYLISGIFQGLPWSFALIFKYLIHDLGLNDADDVRNSRRHVDRIDLVFDLEDLIKYVGTIDVIIGELVLCMQGRIIPHAPPRGIKSQELPKKDVPLFGELGEGEVILGELYILGLVGHCGACASHTCGPMAVG